jgi:hypothetical protein
MKWLLAFLGAVLTIASTAILGLRLHRWMQWHAPAVAAWIPPDGGVAVGLVAGMIVVAGWVG